MIVIVVIGILAAITIVSYSGIQQRARNAQIVSGFDAYKTALLSYQAVNGSYPVIANACLGANYPSDECWVGPNGYSTVNTFMDNLLAPYINQKPTVSTRPLQFTPVDKRHGLVYRYVSPTSAFLEYYLEGPSQRCINGSVGAGVIDGTQCVVALPVA